MVDEVHPESKVSYSVKDLFDKVDVRFDKQDALLANLVGTMATKADVKAVHGRIDEIEDRVESVEHTQAQVQTESRAAHAAQAKLANRAKWVVASIVIPITSALIVVLVRIH